MATYLDSSALRVEKETLGSIAATFAEGRYVSSGLTFGPMFPPRNKPQVIWRTCAAVVLLGFVIPLVGANLPCVSCCWTYHGGIAGYCLKALNLSAVIIPALLVWMFLPGLWALFVRRRHQDHGETCV